ncbi:hypothetical protein CEXT_146431 [Caerostris extrusa]|uniref:Uncharacterized protein n=1 Tax=Caerostris extrusa TaxID=172846 RepID=A0AAV4MIH4_CAEEX|nr:hypothetical protein CEXT_146431 [Caerostris extrusa]
MTLLRGGQHDTGALKIAVACPRSDSQNIRVVMRHRGETSSVTALIFGTLARIGQGGFRTFMGPDPRFLGKDP